MSSSTSNQYSIDTIFKFNDEQQHVYSTLMSHAEEGSGQCFFVEGCGGAGKTTVLTKFIHDVKVTGKRVYTCAHTGYAAKLLPEGRTTHSLFGIPVPFVGDLAPSTESAQILRNAEVIVWDEATMSERRVVERVDLMLKQLRGVDALFGGIMIVFGGDWKQTLPIVRKVPNDALLKYTIRGSPIWDKLQKLYMLINMRASSDEKHASWLQALGEGKIHDISGLPGSCFVESEEELIGRVFGRRGSPVEKRHAFSTGAVLCVDNVSSLKLAEKGLDLLDTPLFEYVGHDTYRHSTSHKAISPLAYNPVVCSGMPPHTLRLKVGAPVMLLRNLNVKYGLCNGSRFIVSELSEQMIKLLPLEAAPGSEPVILEQCSFKGDGDRIDTCFTRVQFPIRLAFAMTCNKSQGQTMERVGLSLKRPCFAHGQLYVALSRVRTSEALSVYLPNLKYNKNKSVRNVVIRQLV